MRYRNIGIIVFRAVLLIPLCIFFVCLLFVLNFLLFKEVFSPFTTLHLAVKGILAICAIAWLFCNLVFAYKSPRMVFEYIVHGSDTFTFPEDVEWREVAKKTLNRIEVACDAFDRTYLGLVTGLFITILLITGGAICYLFCEYQLQLQVFALFFGSAFLVGIVLVFGITFLWCRRRLSNHETTLL